MIRYLSLAGLLASAYLLSIARRQVRAEGYVAIGNAFNDSRSYMNALDAYHQAAMANPWEIYYTERELEQLFAVSPWLKNRKSMAAAAMVTADRAVSLHPNDSVAHDLRALALKAEHYGFGTDTLSQSQGEMNQAVSLAPWFKDYRRDARIITQELGGNNK